MQVTMRMGRRKRRPYYAPVPPVMQIVLQSICKTAHGLARASPALRTRAVLRKPRRPGIFIGRPHVVLFVFFIVLCLGVFLVLGMFVRLCIYTYFFIS